MFCTNCTNSISQSKKITNPNFVCVGLQSSGKTSIIQYLTHQQINENIHSTKGFNMRVFKYKGNKTITICDCGGDEKFRHLWDYYYRDSNGIIYVIDSTDKTSLEESGHELISLLNN